jgi:biotin carboxylase
VECFLAKKTLLIISAGIESVAGIEIAKNMGLHVVVSDGNPDAPGFMYADDKIVASTQNIPDTVLKVKNYHEQIRRIDGVICIGSDVPLTVASVASDLCLESISIQSAKLSMDKMEMKKKFKKDNIPIPDFVLLKNKEHLIEYVKKWSYPLVIKPVDNCGARGVLRITKKIDLAWAWNHAMANSPSRKVMLEKYLDGPQISTESMVIDGICHTVGFSDRNYEYIDQYSPYIIENGGDQPSFLSKKIKDKVNNIIEKSGKSIGIKNGVIKGDVVIFKNSPYIIEIAGRLSGGYFCTHQIPFSTGVNFVENAIKMSLGLSVDIDDLKLKYSNFISQRYLFAKPGVVNSVTGLKELEKNSNIKYFNIHVSPGQKTKSPESHVTRAGMVIASGESRDLAIKNANDSIKSLKINYDSKT